MMFFITVLPLITLIWQTFCHYLFSRFFFSSSDQKEKKNRFIWDITILRRPSKKATKTQSVEKLNILYHLRNISWNLFYSEPQLKKLFSWNFQKIVIQKLCKLRNRTYQLFFPHLNIYGSLVQKNRETNFSRKILLMKNCWKEIIILFFFLKRQTSWNPREWCEFFL